MQILGNLHTLGWFARRKISVYTSIIATGPITFSNCWLQSNFLGDWPLFCIILHPWTHSQSNICCIFLRWHGSQSSRTCTCHKCCEIICTGRYTYFPVVLIAMPYAFSSNDSHNKEKGNLHQTNHTKRNKCNTLCHFVCTHQCLSSYVPCFLCLYVFLWLI